jgi:cyanophycin synthetase
VSVSQATQLIPDKIQFLPGTAFGLTQATAIVFVSRKTVPRFSLELLFEQFSLYGISHPDVSPNTRSEPEMLFASLVYFAGALQRSNKIPVSEIFRVLSVNSDTLILAMPYVDIRATNSILLWINQAIANFFAHQVLSNDLDAPAGKLPEEVLITLRQFRVSGINNFRFIRAADKLKIPVRRIVPGMYAYGTGQYTRILDSSYTDSTSVIGARLAADKVYTATVLRHCGLPAPIHGLASDESQALSLAGKIGYPVVVKPADREQGVGVYANLSNCDEVKLAFGNTRKFSNRVLVEKHFNGVDHRLTVYKNRVLQVVSKIPGGIVGDGVHSLSELVVIAKSSAENQRRLRDFGKPLLELDTEAIELARKLDLQPDSIVPQGQRVPLRRKANISAGGTPVPVPLDQVHPDNLRLAVSAAQSLNLNLAGIDLLIPDISRSWLECGALICEVNSQPQISQTERPEIYSDILTDLIGSTHSIPVWLCITESNHTLPPLSGQQLNINIAYSNINGTWTNGQRTTGKPANSFTAAKALLADRTIAGAVVSMTSMDLLRFGLPALHCESILIDQKMDKLVREIIRRHAVSVKTDILIHTLHMASFSDIPTLRITADKDPTRLLAARIERYFAMPSD